MANGIIPFFDTPIEAAQVGIANGMCFVREISGFDKARFIAGKLLPDGALYVSLGRRNAFLRVEKAQQEFSSRANCPLNKGR
jgi:hypothetical protein